MDLGSSAGYAGSACVADPVTHGMLCWTDGSVQISAPNTSQTQTFGQSVPAGPVLGTAGDGSAIVRSPAMGLYLVARATGQVHRLTADTDYVPTSAVVSPDGSTVAFTAERDGTATLFLVPITGGTPTQLVNYTPIDGAHLLAWHTS